MRERHRTGIWNGTLCVFVFPGMCSSLSNCESKRTSAMTAVSCPFPQVASTTVSPTFTSLYQRLKTGVAGRPATFQISDCRSFQTRMHCTSTAQWACRKLHAPVRDVCEPIALEEGFLEACVVSLQRPHIASAAQRAPPATHTTSPAALRRFGTLPGAAAQRREKLRWVFLLKSACPSAPAERKHVKPLA